MDVVSIPRGTTHGQCACLYARAGLVGHFWWVGTGAKEKKKKTLMDVDKEKMNRYIIKYKNIPHHFEKHQVEKWKKQV
jgi:hypothetical protein